MKFIAKFASAKTVTFIIGIAAMIALLQYNWAHTASMFQNYIADQSSARYAAFGVELAVIWFSWRLGQLKNLEKRVFISIPGITLICVMLVSMVANWSEGFKVKHGIALTSQTIQLVDWMDIVFGILATVMVSAIVFALSEVLSGDSKKLAPKQIKTANDSVAVSEKEIGPRICVVERESIPNTKITETPESYKHKPKNDKENVFIKYIQENPYASYRDIVKNTNVVSNVSQIKSLAEGVGYHKNGNGWEKTNE